jgi:hypothetical protein
LLVAGLVLTALVSAPALAHLKIDGTWSYRYYSREPGSGALTRCQNNTGKVDPINLIFYQYGEYNRIDDHIRNETHLGNFSGHSPQVLCQTDNGSTWGTHGEFNEQQGHGCLTHCLERAHMRLWFAPHGHPSNVDKWTVAGVHHEEVQNFSHVIDEDWETWETHIASEMYDHHNVYWYAYSRASAGFYRGWYDDGYVTRIGGLHDGGY